VAVPSPNVLFTAETGLGSVEQHLFNCLQQEGLMRAGKPPRLLVAYSGGNDSTALLHAASRLRDLYDVEVVAGYYNHNWRGKPAPELPRLHKNCLHFRVPLFVLQAHPQAKQSETSAREFRYKGLARLAYTLKADVTLTAHHSDDQLETLMFRLFRGTGVDGLTGIRQRRSLPVPYHSESEALVLRPLLGLSRVDLETYMATHELLAFEDPSNQSNKHSRNVLRNQLLPGLNKEFPQLKASLLRLSETVFGDLDMLHHHLDKVWEDLCLSSEAIAELPILLPAPVLDTGAFCQLGHAYQRRLMRRLLMSHGLSPDFKQVERAVAFATGSISIKKDRPRWSLGLNEQQEPLMLLRLPQAVGVQCMDAKASAQMLSGVLPATETELSITLTLPSKPSETIEVAWPKGGVFRVTKIETLPATLPNPDSDGVIVSLAHFQKQALTIRVRQAGDRFSPFGLEGESLRLKKYLNSHKVPLATRQNLPLLVCDEEVLWLPCFAISDYLKVNPASKRPEGVYAIRWLPKQAHAMPPETPFPLLFAEADKEDEGEDESRPFLNQALDEDEF
jgi:tRNA(Ile)-lysidine synthase